MPSYFKTNGCAVVFLIAGFVAVFVGLDFRYGSFPDFAFDLHRSRFLTSPAACTSENGPLKDALCEKKAFAAWKLSTEELEEICRNVEREPASEILKIVSGWSGDPSVACPKGKRVKFYVFNVTNPEAIAVSGALPEVHELEPVLMWKKEGRTVSSEDAEHWERTGNALYSNHKRYVLMEGQEDLVEQEVVIPYLPFWTTAFKLNTDNVGNMEALLGGYIFVGALSQTLGLFQSENVGSSVMVPVAASLGFLTIQAKLESEILPLLVPEFASRLSGNTSHTSASGALAYYLSEALNTTIKPEHLNIELLNLQISDNFIFSFCRENIDSECSLLSSDQLNLLQTLFVGNLTRGEASSLAEKLSSPLTSLDLLGNCSFSSAACPSIASLLDRLARFAFLSVSGENVTDFSGESLLKLQLKNSGVSRTITAAFGMPQSRTLRDLAFLLGEEIQALPVLSAVATLHGCIDSTLTPQQCEGSSEDSNALGDAGVDLLWSLVELAVTGTPFDPSLISIVASFHLTLQSLCDDGGALQAPASDCESIHGLFLSSLALNAAATSSNFGVAAAAAPFFVKLKVKEVLGIFENGIQAGKVDPWFGAAGPLVTLGAASDVQQVGKTEVIRALSAPDFKGIGFFMKSDGKAQDCRYDLDCVLPRQLSPDPAQCSEAPETFCTARKVTGFTDVRLPGTLYGRKEGTDEFDVTGATATIFSQDLFSTVKLKLQHRRELWAPEGVSDLKKIEMNRWRVVEVEARTENCDMSSGGSRGIDCDSPKRSGTIAMLVQWPSAPPLYASSPHFFEDPWHDFDDEFPERDADIYEPLERIKLVPCRSQSCEKRDFFSELLVEPESGLVIAGANRLMISARLQWKAAKPTSVLLTNFGGDNPEMEGDMLIPLYWLSEEAGVTNHQFDGVFGVNIYFDLAEVFRFAALLVMMFCIVFSSCCLVSSLRKYEIHRRSISLPWECGANARPSVSVGAEEAFVNDQGDAALPAAGGESAVQHPNTVLNV